VLDFRDKLSVSLCDFRAPLLSVQFGLSEVNPPLKVHRDSTYYMPFAV
jgi:hypothetical protein